MAERAPLQPSISGYELFKQAPRYAVGDSFTWKLDEGWNQNVFYSQDLTIHVLQPFNPFTCSPVMRVKFDTKQGPRIAILKTYDRRYGWFSRRVPKSPQTRDKEIANKQKTKSRFLVHEINTDDLYADLVQKGRVPQLWRNFDSGKYLPQKRSPAMECYFQYQREGEFLSEVKAYQQMARYQGRNIPCFIASMSWRPECANSQFLAVRAILIEEIEGARTLESFFAKPGLIMTDTIRTTIEENQVILRGLMKNAGVLDADRHNRNVLIVVKSQSPFIFRLVQIDFGYSVVTPPKMRPILPGPAPAAAAQGGVLMAGQAVHRVPTQVERNVQAMLVAEDEPRVQVPMHRSMNIISPGVTP